MDEYIQKEINIGQLSKQGTDYHQSGDIERAIKCYKEAYDLARETNNEKTERTCSFNLGAAYIANEMPSDGLKYLHKAIPPEDQRDDRSNGDLYFNMGLCHEMLGKEDKAVEDFEKANAEYQKYERDKTELQIQCLEKCFQIYKEREDFLEAASICQLMADAFDGKDELSKAEKLCEKATQLRLAKKTEKAMEAAEECKNVLNNIRPKGDDCIVAGKILNDVGLLFTQLLEYPEATSCFEKALELIHCSHKVNHQLEAVVLQNLGAAYNFNGDYQRAIKYHEDAAEKYALIKYRNGQGQCFTNLAFAQSQLGDLKNAEIAYHHAYLAAKDTRDSHMKWQALEGLGAVNFNLGNMEDSKDYFIEALKAVGDNKPASVRIKEKMLSAIHAAGSKKTAAPYRGQDHMMFTGNHTGRKMLMSMHGPAEEHNQLSATPRLQPVNELVIEPRQTVPLAVDSPAMSTVQETIPKRRIIQMRKKDSIGPHMPKVSQGLGSITYDSPRFAPNINQRQQLLEESSETDDSETDSSSGTSETSEASSREDQPDQPNVPLTSKIDEIFQRPPPVETQRDGGEEEQHLEKYAEQLRAREENEDATDDDSSDNSSSDDDSDDSDTDIGHDDQTHVKQPVSHPSLPAQSPTTSTQVSTKHLGTNLTPDPQLTQDAQPAPDANTIHTVADIHQPSDSSHRVDKQPPKTAESPREKSENDSGDECDEEDDENPHASTDTATKFREPVSGQGNETGSVHQKRSGRRSQNFLDSDRSSLDQNEKNEDSSGEGQEDPEPNDGAGRSSAMHIEDLPRGQREQILAHYHQEHQGHRQESPPLPERDTEKSSKTCVIM